MRKGISGRRNTICRGPEAARADPGKSVGRNVPPRESGCYQRASETQGDAGTSSSSCGKLAAELESASVLTTVVRQQDHIGADHALPTPPSPLLSIPLLYLFPLLLPGFSSHSHAQPVPSFSITNTTSRSPAVGEVGRISICLSGGSEGQPTA